MNRRNFIKLWLASVAAVFLPRERKPPRRKFRCKYSFESAQRLREIYGVAPGEDELIARMVGEIKKETTGA